MTHAYVGGQSSHGSGLPMLALRQVWDPQQTASSKFVCLAWTMTNNGTAVHAESVAQGMCCSRQPSETGGRQVAEQCALLPRTCAPYFREKEAIARTHSRALEAAKQAAADERSAWRAAVTESLKRQAADREEKLRAELLKQRDEQLQVGDRHTRASAIGDVPFTGLA